MPFPKNASPFFPGAVVGTLPDADALQAALALRKGAVDLLELRVDAFAGATAALDELETAAKRLRRIAPLIVTVRHPAEGGENALSLARRRALFRRFLPCAALVDVELRSAVALADICREAREAGVGVILSHHNFRATPPLEKLLILAKNARKAGADVFKLATVAENVKSLSVLVQFLEKGQAAWENGQNSEGKRQVAGKNEQVAGKSGQVAGKNSRPALAVMGMGALGKLSRVTLARSGSVLNYGYLATPQVPGQWPAILLKERLREV